jgi:hypothetical protein
MPSKQEIVRPRAGFVGSWRFSTIKPLTKVMSPFPKQEAEVLQQSTSKNLRKSSSTYLFASTPAERFFALDCAVSTQSRANPFGRSGGVGRDYFQPHNRQRFASRGFAKPDFLACRLGSRAVSGEFLNWLIPRNLRKRPLLQVSDLYRGFESFPLRHAV